MLLQMAKFHSFLWLSSIPLCIYIYHIFIRSSVGGHLGCFHILAIVNNAAVNTGVHVERDWYHFVHVLLHFVFLLSILSLAT